MAKNVGGKDYFGFTWIVSLILAIIPFTSWLFGFITRFKDHCYVAAILRIFFGWNIIWLLDLIFMILTHHIFKIFAL